MVLHELYFSNLKPGGEARPSDRQALGRELIETYGSVDQWQQNFQAIGGMRGIGWVILYEDPANGRLVNQWISLHQDGVPARWKPILVMDVWEHAFMRDYKATERSKYVDAFLKNVDWTTVDQRLREATPARSEEERERHQEDQPRRHRGHVLRPLDGWRRPLAGGAPPSASRRCGRTLRCISHAPSPCSPA